MGKPTVAVVIFHSYILLPERKSTTLYCKEGCHRGWQWGRKSTPNKITTDAGDTSIHSLGCSLRFERSIWHMTYAERVWSTQNSRPCWWYGRLLTPQQVSDDGIPPPYTSKTEKSIIADCGVGESVQDPFQIIPDLIQWIVMNCLLCSNSHGLCIPLSDKPIWWTLIEVNPARNSGWWMGLY